MKIRKVKWQAHPILGDLELDFINSTTGEPYEVILFAGENGTGKTTILETISTFLNRGTFEYFEYIEYVANGQVLKAIPASERTITKSFYDMVDVATGTTTKMHTNKNSLNETVDKNPLNIRFDGCVLSKARADYKTQQIKHTTTQKLDVDKSEVDENDDFTSLKQLIVDVENQDNAEFRSIAENTADKTANLNSFEPHSRIFRFKKSFNNFFDNLKYDKVADQGSEKAILFKKNNQSILIDKLSTGEKQIVFRGAYLLKNSNNLNGAVIMIDEPELSMHPKWQAKILQYYKNLFTESGIQKAQLFFATHSENVLKEALSNKSQNIVIVLTENSGAIKAKRIDVPAILPIITDAETNYLAFDMVSTDYHIELYGHLQHKTSHHKVKDCDTYIISQTTVYNPAIHAKASSNPNGTTYDSLITYIRNAIDHPSSGLTYTAEELRISTEVLIKLCKLP
jgi:predicted ATP-binding protein involved in virulence